MISSKDKVLSYIRQYTSDFAGEERPAVSTQFLSEQFHIQRPNMSSLLNKLAEEGVLEKINGRPVLYRLSSEHVQQEETILFHELVGWEGSMQEALQQVKAALLWPHAHHMFFTAVKGCGLRYLAERIYQAAIDYSIFSKDAPLRVFDCFTFSGRQEELHSALFGDPAHAGILNEVQGGLLLLKNIQMLNGFDRNLLCAILEEDHSFYASRIVLPKDFHTTILCSVPPDTESDIQELLSEKCGCCISLPTLSDRPLSERLELIHLFLQAESDMSGKSFIVDINILQDLLLYPQQQDINGLKRDIHTGCAAAYARNAKSKKTKIILQLSDFPYVIRKGILYYKYHKKELKSLLPEDGSYIFDKKGSKKIQTSNTTTDIYRHLHQQKKQEDSGLFRTEERLAFLANDFYSYFDELSTRVSRREQLEHLVSKKLISLAEDFIDRASVVFHRTYPDSILFGLCLHINMALVAVSKRQVVENEVVKKVIEQHKEIYRFTKSFMEVIKKEFGVLLSIDELVFIMLLLAKEQMQEEPVGEVVTIFVLHGESSATSLQSVVNQMVPENQVYAYDIPLDKRVEEVYEELKVQLISIHRGKGILVIYDMGSIRTMCESIAWETQIQLRYFEMPLTLVGIACAQETKKCEDIDRVYDTLQLHYQDFLYRRKKPDSSIILLLEHTYEQENKKLSEYLKEHFKGEEEVIQLSLDDRNDLFNEISILMKKYKITGIIGTYDPSLSHLAYCSVKQMYECEICDAHHLFHADSARTENEELNDVMEYLQEQFTACDMQKLKPLLMTFLKQLKERVQKELNLDKKIEIIIHVSCLMERLLLHQTPAVNFEAASIFRECENLISIVKKLLKPMEQEFHVLINDSEAATIVSIIR